MYPNLPGGSAQQPASGLQSLDNSAAAYSPLASQPHMPAYPAFMGQAPPIYAPAPGYQAYPHFQQSPYHAPPGYPQVPGHFPMAGYAPQSGSVPGYVAYPTLPQQTLPAPLSPTVSGFQNTATAHQQQQNTAVGGDSGKVFLESQNSPAIEQYKEIPTILESPFSTSSDAQALRKAIKSLETEAAALKILAKRTNNQRQLIAQSYKTSFNRDLVKDLKKELGVLSGGKKLKEVVLALMAPNIEYLAQKLEKAFSGIGTREQTFVDVLCTASNDEIRQISATYAKLFSRSLETDLSKDTKSNGYLRRLLLSVIKVITEIESDCEVKAERNEDPTINSAIALQDVQELYSAGEKRMRTNEQAFNRIISTRSFAQIRLMLHEYERLTGHSFEKAIQSEFSGDTESGLVSVVKSARNRAAYFADRLHVSLAGMNRNDDDLMFIIVTRADIDMDNIKQEYIKKYKKSLAQQIYSTTSGDYKKILLALIGGMDAEDAAHKDKVTADDVKLGTAVYDLATKIL